MIKFTYVLDTLDSLPNRNGCTFSKDSFISLPSKSVPIYSSGSMLHVIGVADVDLENGHLVCRGTVHQNFLTLPRRGTFYVSCYYQGSVENGMVKGANIQSLYVSEKTSSRYAQPISKLDFTIERANTLKADLRKIDEVFQAIKELERGILPLYVRFVTDVDKTAPSGKLKLISHVNGVGTYSSGLNSSMDVKAIIVTNEYSPPTIKTLKHAHKRLSGRFLTPISESEYNRKWS